MPFSDLGIDESLIIYVPVQRREHMKAILADPELARAIHMVVRDAEIAAKFRADYVERAPSVQG